MLGLKSFRARLLLSGCGAMALAILAAGAAKAQDQNQSAIENVVVTGQAYALQKSIDDKREATVVSDGIAADEIGQTPEFGIGDALRKVPGLTLVINNGRGEDQFLTIRGLNPDYDTTTVDGMALPSTEETVRSVSLDVIPSVLVNSVDVNKTWTVDQPTDAIGGVTDLHTRSAFDHPGEFFDSHIDGAYWTNTEEVRSKQPSGQADFTYSNTFGPSNEFGFLVLGSYFQRSSSTLNTYTLGYSYYPYSGSGTAANVLALEQTSATATSTTLKPSDMVTSDIAIPDRHRWYFYDNDRTRPGVFTRLDFNDHAMFHADIEGGVFEFVNDESRSSQYLNRVGGATITSDTTGSFASGSPEVDYDKYVQYREINYINANAGADFASNTHLTLTLNYGVGQYRQTDDEDQFTAPSSATYAFTYDLSAPTAPLFIPTNEAAFLNPANYNEAYHEYVVDQSISHLPQARLEFNDNADAKATGFGFKIGWSWRDLSQSYYLTQYRLNAVGTAPTLATIGTINKNISLYDGEGQTLLLINPADVIAFVAANPSRYTENATDAMVSTINNYKLSEMIQAGYAEAQYRIGDFFAMAGLRYESTDQNISNYLPVPFSSTTNFVLTSTANHYGRLLPSLNVVYDVTDTLKLRGAVTQNLARPEYGQLAQNSSATVSGTTASETISNPALKPRESTNFDLSAEYYPTEGIIASVAVFDKSIKNEIISLTSSAANVTIPGTALPVTLTTTTSENANSAYVTGVELSASDVKFEFLPGFLSDFGASANLGLVQFDAPYIRMSDGSFRKLPQLVSSSKSVANIALLYSHDQYSGQIAYNYTSKMPISFDTNNPVNDQWWAGIGTLDAQVMYKLDENISFRIQGKNLTDSVPQKVVGLNQQLNYSSLENGRAFYFGIGVAL